MDENEADEQETDRDMRPEERPLPRYGDVVIGKILIVEGVCYQGGYVKRGNENEEVAHPFLTQGGIHKAQKKPCDSIRYDAVHDHAKRVKDGEEIGMAHEWHGIQQSPAKELGAEQE